MNENSSVLGTGRRTDRSGAEERMFSLMEVAQETGIAMPILLRYKREHPDRIPSAGSGAQQRFPEKAFAIFQQIHDEEMNEREAPRRGGFGLLSLPRVKRSRERPEDRPEPRPTASEADEPAQESRRQAAPAESTVEPTPGTGTPASTATTGEATLTLKDISETLGIAYPTVARYATKFPDRIPHEGEGRRRRFPPEAIEVVRQIRKESKPGRPPKSKSKAKPRTEPARRPAPTPAPRQTGQDAALSAGFGARSETAADADLLRRIDLLERHQEQLETMVRALREEVERPLVATVERT